MISKKKIIVRELKKNTQTETFIVGQEEEQTIIFIAAQATEYSLTVKLSGSGAQANILGLVIGAEQNQININTNQDHESPNTVSDLHIKSILGGQAVFNYQGFIRIAKNAQKSNAYQRNDNLLLSEYAKAESKPALEILANDVRCTHGATLGKIDEDQLFYLKSRGISQKNAEELIIRGFFASLLEKIKDKDVSNKVHKILEDYI